MKSQLKQNVANTQFKIEMENNAKLHSAYPNKMVRSQLPQLLFKNCTFDKISVYESGNLLSLISSELTSILIHYLAYQLSIECICKPKLFQSKITILIVYYGRELWTLCVWTLAVFVDNLWTTKITADLFLCVISCSQAWVYIYFLWGFSHIFRFKTTK